MFRKLKSFSNDAGMVNLFAEERGGYSVERFGRDASGQIHYRIHQCDQFADAVKSFDAQRAALRMAQVAAQRNK